jgi:hypothetical protein
MLGFKDLRCGRIILSGIVVNACDQEGADGTKNGTHPANAEQFYSMLMKAVLVILGLLIKMALPPQDPSIQPATESRFCT